jgi:hypothetical protein
MQVLTKWHEALKTGDLNILDEILANEVVFYSPVVWSAQEGKFLTKMYLSAAFQVLVTSDFKYDKQVVDGNHACLEFSTKIGDTIINGVDIITTNEYGKIVEFKVMVRPMKAMLCLKDKMLEMLQNMSNQ